MITSRVGKCWLACLLAVGSASPASAQNTFTSDASATFERLSGSAKIGFLFSHAIDDKSLKVTIGETQARELTEKIIKGRMALGTQCNAPDVIQQIVAQMPTKTARHTASKRGGYLALAVPISPLVSFDFLRMIGPPFFGQPHSRH